MTRLVILDTETTGFSPAEGHRLVEIGCVEMISMRKSGETFHHYLHPERPIPLQATQIHGITDEKVANSPRFAEIAASFLAFIGDAQLVIHNAAFDMGFLNAELTRAGLPTLPRERAIDTLEIARRKFPGASASLDALCKRLGVDNTHRSFHGALLDAHLLADVYVELNGGSQIRMALEWEDLPKDGVGRDMVAASCPLVFPVRNFQVSMEEEEAHQAFLQLIQKESGDCLWLRSAPV